MPYYDTIEEDLKRAREILAKGRGEYAKEVEQLLRGTGTDRENTLLGSGGTIYGGDTYAAYKLLESFVAEIEKLTEQLRQVLAGKVELRGDLTVASERVLTLELENQKLVQLLDLLKEREPYVANS